MEDLKKHVESVLFSSGRKMDLSEIARLVKEKDLDAVLRVLEELKGEYDARGSSLMVIQDGAAWKIAVREAYLGTVRKIVTQTELPKSVMETLAVIAYKAPVLQSHIIQVRTNKAYDHLALLEQDGFITRAKHGRTKMIKIAQKFFDYFDIPEDQLKQKFSNVLALEKTIQEKEGEIEGKRAEAVAAQGVMKAADEAHKKHVASEHQRLDAELAKMPEIDLVDDAGKEHALETFDTTPVPDEPDPAPGIETVKVNGMETYGEELPETVPEPLPVVHEKKSKKSKTVIPEPAVAPAEPSPEQSLDEKAEAEIQKARDEVKQEAAGEAQEAEAPIEVTDEEIEQIARDIAAGKKGREFAGKGIFQEGISEDIQKRIDARVEELVHGDKP